MLTLDGDNYSGGDTESFSENEVIFDGKLSDCDVFIVTNGRLHICEESEGKLQVLAEKSVGSFVGEDFLFSDSGARQICIFAAEGSTIIRISKRDIENVIQKCPDWVNDLIVTLTSRLDHSISALREHRIHDPEFFPEVTQVSKYENLYKNSLDSYRANN